MVLKFTNFMSIISREPEKEITNDYSYYYYCYYYY